MGDRFIARRVEGIAYMEVAQPELTERKINARRNWLVKVCYLLPGDTGGWTFNYRNRLLI